MPPRPPSFPGKLAPTPSPVSENQRICTSLSADVVSSYMCTNYCNNDKATSKDTKICQYCPENHHVILLLLHILKEIHVPVK